MAGFSVCLGGEVDGIQGIGGYMDNVAGIVNIECVKF